MLESILYFLLGFLAAALLALMVSPMIWQRAVSLTKRRIERSVPLTLNEIQADKDQMRAEFAMSTRRLEMSVDDLREKAATQIIEVNRKRDDIARLAEEHREKIFALEDIQTKSVELSVQLLQREEQLEVVNQRLSESQENLAEKTSQIEELHQEFDKLQTKSDGRNIGLKNISEKLQMFDRPGSSTTVTSSNARKELAKTKVLLETQQLQNEELEKKLDAATRQSAGNHEHSERRELELSQLREALEKGEISRSELTTQVIEQQALNVELEAKLAHSSLQMEALLQDASNDNVEKAMASLEGEKISLADKLQLVSSERDKLAEELSSVSENHGSEWESERRENSLLRERINDLAAQVTAMSASLEGDASPINEILARQDNTKPPRDEKPSKTEPPVTLADRIRALRDAAG